MGSATRTLCVAPGSAVLMLIGGWWLFVHGGKGAGRGCRRLGLFVIDGAGCKVGSRHVEARALSRFGLHVRNGRRAKPTGGRVAVNQNSALAILDPTTYRGTSSLLPFLSSATSFDTCRQLQTRPRIPLSRDQLPRTTRPHQPLIVNPAIIKCGAGAGPCQAPRPFQSLRDASGIAQRRNSRLP